eukprot:12614719-Alexandrium_andersonii.AAC.1
MRPPPTRDPGEEPWTSAACPAAPAAAAAPAPAPSPPRGTSRSRGAVGPGGRRRGFRSHRPG